MSESHLDYYELRCTRVRDGKQREKCLLKLQPDAFNRLHVQECRTLSGILRDVKAIHQEIKLIMWNEADDHCGTPSIFVVIFMEENDAKKAIGSWLRDAESLIRNGAEGITDEFVYINLSGKPPAIEDIPRGHQYV